MAKCLIPFDGTMGVGVLDGRAVVSSRAVAEEFGKQHKNVLQAIGGLDCSKEFARLNFQPTSYRDEQRRRQPEYLITRDGFIFLVMGFTGKKAARIKEQYIQRFNQMERYIADRNKAKLEYHGLTDAIQAAHIEPQFYHYRNEADLINRIVLGMTAKEYRLAHGVPKDTLMRDCLNPWQVAVIERMQGFDAGLVSIVPDFQQRKQMLQEYFDRLRTQLLPEPGQAPDALP